MPERFQKILEQQSTNKTVEKVSKLKPFLSSFLTLIKDKEALAKLEALVEALSGEGPPPKKVNNIKTRLKTGCKLRMTTQIGDYDMDYIILDLGSNVNILTCQMWEIMGKPPLEWSQIQLRLSNQAKVIPVGRQGQVEVDLGGLRTFMEFEVIDIIDDTTPYLALLGIDWEIENQAIINFKRRILSFEDDEMWVVTPLDPLEGPRHVEPVFNEGNDDLLDTIYKITTLR